MLKNRLEKRTVMPQDISKNTRLKKMLTIEKLCQNIREPTHQVEANAAKSYVQDILDSNYSYEVKNKVKWQMQEE